MSLDSEADLFDTATGAHRDPPEYQDPLDRALFDIRAERASQDRKLGVALRRELIQTAAVIVAWIEDIDTRA